MLGNFDDNGFLAVLHGNFRAWRIGRNGVDEGAYDIHPVGAVALGHNMLHCHMRGHIL
ncbi:hypothetical protein D3C76_1669470 [compost metagenome]